MEQPAQAESDTRKKRKRFQNIEGYLFIAPSVILISIFGIFPIFFTLFVSSHKWRIRRGRFLGFDNFLEMFGGWQYILLVLAAVAVIIVGTKLRDNFLKNKAEGLGDSRDSTKTLGTLAVLLGIAGFVILIPMIWLNGDSKMLDSLRVTIWYSLGTVPTQLASGLIVAVLLDRKFKGKQVFRVIYLLPYIVPAIATAAVFERLFALRPESFANQLLLAFGKEPLNWLQEPKGIFLMMTGGTGEVPETFGGYWLSWIQGPSLALSTIMIFNWWVFTGYYALIYANGLSQIPKQLYEAAEIDGASKLKTFFRITIPLLSPTTFFLTMLGIMGTFKAFNHIFVLRNPGARGAVDAMSIHIFFTFFRKQRFGYAAAMSLILLGIVMALTMIQRKIMEKKVFYGE